MISIIKNFYRERERDYLKRSLRNFPLKIISKFRIFLHFKTFIPRFAAIVQANLKTYSNYLANFKFFAFDITLLVYLHKSIQIIFNDKFTTREQLCCKNR
jgi:hypothetical protein